MVRPITGIGRHTMAIMQAQILGMGLRGIHRHHRHVLHQSDRLQHRRRLTEPTNLTIHLLNPQRLHLTAQNVPAIWVVRRKTQVSSVPTTQGKLRRKAISNVPATRVNQHLWATVPLTPTAAVAPTAAADGSDTLTATEW